MEVICKGVSFTRRRGHRSRRLRGIYDGLGFIRSRIMADGAGGINADVILEELAERGDVLSDAYASMLISLRTNDRSRGLNEFTEKAGIREAREYGRLILDTDNVPPSELYDMLRNFQRSIGDVRITEQRKRDSVISDILYIPVVANMILIIFDFVYTAFFLQQKDMLMMLM